MTIAITILKSLKGHDLLTVPELHARTGLDPQKIADALIELLDVGKVEHRKIVDGGCSLSGWRRKR